MTLLSDTAYPSFIGEVEALNTTTIRRLIPSARHQLPAIAREVRRLALVGSPLFCAAPPTSPSPSPSQSPLTSAICPPIAHAQFGRGSSGGNREGVRAAIGSIRPAPRLRFSLANRSNRRNGERQRQPDGLRRRKAGEGPQNPRPGRRASTSRRITLHLERHSSGPVQQPLPEPRSGVSRLRQMLCSRR
jgi:hypothetical protein